MPGDQEKPEEAAADLENLMGWLEDERTRDLVDMINRAAQGLPVKDAADRYKARYRHSDSLEKLSDMFDSLKQKESQAAQAMASCGRQLKQCRQQLEAASAAYDTLLEEEHAPGGEEKSQLQQLLDELRELSDSARRFRERIISQSSSENGRPRDRLRIIGSGGGS